MSSIGAAIYGNSSSDEYVDACAVDRDDNSIRITFHDGSVATHAVKATESKVSLQEIPALFPKHVVKRRAGGGGVNSRISLARTADELGVHEEIRYLDANEPSSFIKSELSPPVRWLGLRGVPRNYVFGTRDDKCIFRSPVSPAVALGARQLREIDWCCQTGVILLNGPKDHEPVEAIFDRRAGGGFEVICVLTPSLDVAALKRTALTADVLIGAWDELPVLAGPAPVSVSGAATTAQRLRDLAPRAEIHDTMGKYGVLSMAAGANAINHVRLDPASGAFTDVQAIVRSRPANLCGAGDAFAGGLLGMRAFGWSLVSVGSTVRPHIRAAMAGCASALRWVGFRSDVNAESFLIEPVLA